MARWRRRQGEPAQKARRKRCPATIPCPHPKACRNGTRPPSRPRRRREGAELDHARGHHGQAAVHRGRHGRPACRMPTRCRASSPSCAARRPRCTRCGPWTIRQYAGFSTAEASNAFYRKALAAGGGGVGGVRPRHAPRLRQRPPARDRRRRQGRVAIDSVEDMKILFDGIPLDKVSVSMTMNGAGAAGAGRLRGGGGRAGRERRTS